jgi:hypothetical protein
MKKLILLFFIVFSTMSAQAQEQRFKAGFHLGMNASQINGDQNYGYHKIGINGGLRVATQIKEKMQIITEINYASRGSQASISNNNNNGGFFRINMRYIEVPIMFNLMDWKGENDDHYKIHFNAGLSYGRLISSSATGATVLAGRSDEFLKKNNLSANIGFVYYPRLNLGYHFRYTRDLTPSYVPKAGALNTDSLVGYYLTLGVTKMFGDGE